MRDEDQLHPIIPALIAGWLLGAADAAVVVSPRSVLTIGFGVLLATLPSLLVGLVMWGIAALYRRSRWPQISSAWLERHDTHDPQVDREPVIRAQALTVSILLSLLGAGLASWLVFRMLFELQLRDLAAQFAILFAIGLVVLVVALALVLALGLRVPLRALDKRFPLPIPRPRWARFLVLVTVPTFAGVYPFLRQHEDAIGRGADVLTIALLVCGAVQMLLLLGPRRALRRKRATQVVALVAAAMTTAAALAYRPAHAAASAAERSTLGSIGGRLGRALTDVDLDGHSALFGGHDCAGFDASRAPDRSEIFGNGIDENCDGKDATPTNVDVALGSVLSGIDERQVRRYNILWIIVESLRADHIPAWGYPKPTMPYVSQLANESLQYMDAQSQSSATIYSLPSMMTGVIPGALRWYNPPPTRGVYGSGQPNVHRDNKMLAERLAQDKYASAIVIENYVNNTMESLVRGFDRVYLTEPDRSKRINRGRRNPFAVGHVADFLARNEPNRPFLMAVYLVDSHGPYTRHPDIDSSPFARSTLGNYDAELAWTDETIRGIVEVVRSRRMIWDNTIVIVTADHGEEFNEHGGNSHARTCHDEVTHVPLLVRIPGVEPQRIDTRVALVDVVPTLLELTGNKTSLESLSGQSLLIPVLARDRLTPNRPIFCAMASVSDKKGTFFRRSVRQDHWSLHQDVRDGAIKLFDIQSDRSEQNDLADEAEHRPVVERMTALLAASLTGNLRDHEQMAKESKP